MTFHDNHLYLQFCDKTSPVCSHQTEKNGRYYVLELETFNSVMDVIQRLSVSSAVQHSWLMVSVIAASKPYKALRCNHAQPVWIHLFAQRACCNSGVFSCRSACLPLKNITCLAHMAKHDLPWWLYAFKERYCLVRNEEIKKPVLKFCSRFSSNK